MRRILQFGAVLVLLALATATWSLYSLYRTSESTIATTQAQERATGDQYAQALNAIAEIQDSLATILPPGEKLPGATPGYSAEREMGGANPHEILDRIAVLRAGLQRGRERIAKLEADLHHSGVRLASLQRIIGGLRESVKEKEAELTALGTQLAEVRDTLAVHDQMLVDRQRELATVFMVEGPKRELLKSGVLEARGGVLGMGKTLRPAADIPEPLFTTLDTDQQSVVRFDAKKVQVVSAQPRSSYQLLLVDGRMELHILDPASFRKVRQLVVVTA